MKRLKKRQEATSTAAKNNKNILFKNIKYSSTSPVENYVIENWKYKICIIIYIYIYVNKNK